MRYIALALLLFFQVQAAQVTVIGTGYVGLVLGACLAYYDNQVICADIDQHKIEALRKGTVPFYEPQLWDFLRKAYADNNISFTTEIERAINASHIIFIAVGTPASESGKADLTALMNVVRTIAETMDGHKIICIKSTIPIGTTRIVEGMLKNNKHGVTFDLVFNPEFLREGSAVHDFLHPDRVVLGTDSLHAAAMIDNFYRLIIADVPSLITNYETAEMIKYAANTFLATKISFINELAQLCEATGAHVNVVAKGMGLDSRIGQHFLAAGPGYGGSCFPKDVAALVHTAHEHNVDLKIVNACVAANEKQKNVVIEKLLKHFDHNLADKKIGILGLAFKAQTDDVRYSPALSIIQNLQHSGAHVKAYDPQAMRNMKSLFPSITYTKSADEVLTDIDALVIATEWKEFGELDLHKVKQENPDIFIVDARNMLNTKMLRKLQIDYENIGNADTVDSE